MKQPIPCTFGFASLSPVDSIIESPFRETTRNGNNIRSVLLALTPGLLLITEPGVKASHPENTESDENQAKRLFLFHLNSLRFTVFKKSYRQTLKICFTDDSDRYFELDKNCSKKVTWKLWCRQVIKLQQRNGKTLWIDNILNNNPISLDWSIVTQAWNPQNFDWRDKHLYLGSKRELEDHSRPSPVPGLGRAEDIKLLYLKPQYFGCWDQSEHWVQCESSKRLSQEP